jgi:hypothetical protein
MEIVFDHVDVMGAPSCRMIARDEPGVERWQVFRITATPKEVVADEFNRSFTLVRVPPCDVPLGDHGAQYNMQQPAPSEVPWPTVGKALIRQPKPEVG